MQVRALFAALFVALAVLFSGTGVSALDSRDGKNRWVTVYNDSRFQTIVSIHAVPSRSRQVCDTDPDLIPDRTIAQANRGDCRSTTELEIASTIFS